MRPAIAARLLVTAILVTAAGSALAGFPGSDLFLPMAGRQAGVHPSNWYTTMWIYNPGTEAATARVYFLECNTAASEDTAIDAMRVRIWVVGS